MTERKDIVTFGGNPTTLLGKEIKVGDKAPNFVALMQDLKDFDFYRETEDKVVIISSVPSVDTGVCELQTITFNEEATKLSSDVLIITISVDLPFAQKRFCGAHGIENIVVVSDHRDLDFGEKYGFILKEFRLLSRGVIIIDKDKTVRYVEYVNEVTNHPDYNKALEAVNEII